MNDYYLFRKWLPLLISCSVPFLALIFCLLFNSTCFAVNPKWKKISQYSKRRICNPCISLESKWSNETELSFNQTEGNNNAVKIAFKNLLAYSFTEKLKNHIKVGVLYGETESRRESESYSTEMRLEYFITPHFYIFPVTRWLKNDFIGLKARYYLGPTIGYKFLYMNDHSLLIENGLDYVKEEYTTNPFRDEFAQWRIFSQYEYSYNKKNTLKQSLEYLHDLKSRDNYSFNSISSITSAINDKVSLKISYEAMFDNKPASESIKKTDMVISSAVVINYN